jgi:hypothetical protein
MGFIYEFLIQIFAIVYCIYFINPYFIFLSVIPLLKLKTFIKNYNGEKDKIKLNKIEGEKYK